MAETTYPSSPNTLTARERFDVAAVPQPDGCWTWTGYRSLKGYGSLRVDGRNTLAHRYAFETFIGPIPDGLGVDHSCRNRACVNPDHLRLADQALNMQNLARQGAKYPRGVRPRNGRWEVVVYRRGQRYYGGRFDTMEQADTAAATLRNSVFIYNETDRDFSSAGGSTWTSTSCSTCA